MRKLPQRVGKSASATFLHALQCHASILRAAAQRVRAEPFISIPLAQFAANRAPSNAPKIRFPYRAARYIDRVTDNLIWITLLVKLGVVASVASVLARVTTFRRLFFAEKRSPRQTLALLAFFLVPLTLGVWLRFRVPNFLAADISFETVILLGLLDRAGLGHAQRRRLVRPRRSAPRISRAALQRRPWAWLPA